MQSLVREETSLTEVEFFIMQPKFECHQCCCPDYNPTHCENVTQIWMSQEKEICGSVMVEHAVDYSMF